MSRTEVVIASRTLSGLSVTEPKLLSLLEDQAFKRAWEAREIIKREGDRSVALIRGDDSAYLIKSCRPRFRQRLASCVSPPLRNAHRNLETLHQHGIPIARALAFVRWRDADEPEQWCQIQEYLHGSITMEQALMELGSEHQSQQMMLIAETVKQLARIHKLGRYHGDMKLTNIMVREQEIFLIDIRGHRPIRRRRWQQKDLARFIVGLSEANIQLRQLEDAVALYQEHSGNKGKGFMGGVDSFANKISQRHRRRYGPLEQEPSEIR